MDRTRNQPAPGPAPRRVLRMRPMIAPYWPSTQPHRTIWRKDAGPSSLPTGHVEASRYFEVERIDCPYERIIDKRMVGDRTEYLVVWSSSWISEDLIHPEERSLEEDLAEGPGGPPSTPPNNPLSNSSNVYGENAMGLANMPISNMNPVMLQHSQLSCFPFDPAVPQFQLQPQPQPQLQLQPQPQPQLQLQPQPQPQLQLQPQPQPQLQLQPQPHPIHRCSRLHS